MADSRIKTYRRNFTERAVIYKWFLNSSVERSESVLDFGCGADALMVGKLIEEGFHDVSGVDLSIPCQPKLYRWKHILLSNVLNVQESKEQIEDLAETLVKFGDPSGFTVYWNYPASPRKAGLGKQEAVRLFRELLTEHHKAGHSNTISSIREGKKDAFPNCFKTFLPSLADIPIIPQY